MITEKTKLPEEMKKVKQPSEEAPAPAAPVTGSKKRATTPSPE